MIDLFRSWFEGVVLFVCCCSLLLCLNVLWVLVVIALICCGWLLLLFVFCLGLLFALHFVDLLLNCLWVAGLLLILFVLMLLRVMWSGVHVCFGLMGCCVFVGFALLCLGLH